MLIAATALKVIVAMPGGPGDTVSAEKPLMHLFALWENNAGLPAHTLAGTYYPQHQAAEEALAAETPQILALTPAAFFAREKSLKLTPIAQIAVNHSPSETGYIVVRKETPDDVQALKGKIVLTTLLSDPSSKSLFTLADGTPLATFVKLEYERSPLSSLKKLRAQEVFAVLLDESQWNGLEQLPFAAEMKQLTKTQPFPRPIIAVTPQVDKGVVAQLQKGLLALNRDASAKDLLSQFSVDSFVLPDEALLQKARKRFHSK